MLLVNKDSIVEVETDEEPTVYLLQNDYNYVYFNRQLVFESIRNILGEGALIECVQKDRDSIYTIVT